LSRLYPAMLRLEGQPCVVVGGGQVATRKISRLLQSGAAVGVIAPELSPALQALVEDGRLRLERREYQSGDLTGAALAFAATSSREVNAAVAREAHAGGIPVNVADDPQSSTFQVPAVAERDGLTVAISTSGRSPAYARRLREEIEALFSPERLALLDLYAELRESLPGPRPSADGLAWMAAYEDALELLRRGRADDARRLLRERVLTPPEGET
jgi:precorrin-2 dehydrogenase/sirohydrochlorin ferrochelatase